jgi:transglutaminase-like putative cysteine protease
MFTGLQHHFGGTHHRLRGELRHAACRQTAASAMASKNMNTYAGAEPLTPTTGWIMDLTGSSGVQHISHLF